MSNDPERVSREFTEDPWEGVEMPEGFDPSTNKFLGGEGAGEDGKRTATAKPLEELFDDVIELRDVSCVDAEGNVYERYDRILVPKSFPGQGSGTGDYMQITPYAGIARVETERMFVASTALTCVILVRLFEEGIKKSGEGYKVVNEDMAYKVIHTNAVDQLLNDIQNTLINVRGGRRGRGEIIHYASDADYRLLGVDGTNREVNKHRQTYTLGFNAARFKDCAADIKQKEASSMGYKGLARELPSDFLVNLTGLASISRLENVCRYVETEMQRNTSGLKSGGLRFINLAGNTEGQFDERRYLVGAGASTLCIQSRTTMDPTPQGRQEREYTGVPFVVAVPED